MDSSSLPTHASTSDDDYDRPNAEDLTEGSDAMESMSSEESPPAGSIKGEGNSQDSWNVSAFGS